MNSLHTESWTIEINLGEKQEQEQKQEEKEEEEEDGEGGKGAEEEERHEGVRLCGECSVGHCPECGTQLVPHVPAGVEPQQAKSLKRPVPGVPGAVGLKTVLWYTQLGHSALIIRCPNGDYESEMTMIKSTSTAAKEQEQEQLPPKAATPPTCSKKGKGKGKGLVFTGVSE
jgi:hypothetical protein